MTYLLGVLLLVTSGYSIVILSGLSRTHIMYDIALGWFVGAGYYSLASFIIVFGAGLPVTASSSFLIVLFPILLALFRFKRCLLYVKQSIKNVRCFEYLPANKILSIEFVLVCYSLVVFILIFFHGASTPSSGDDALRVRAYTPILVYENDFTDKALGLFFLNGILPSFLSVFFWHLKGEVAHFYLNYNVITSLFFFLAILYLLPVIKGNARQGIYNVFLVLTLPLFVYHGTITYADIRLAIPLALGFLCLASYLRDYDMKDLKTLLLFFTVTCFIKDKGEIAGITGLAVTLAFITYSGFVKKKIPAISVYLFLIPAVLYFALKNYYVPNIASLTGLVAKASRDIAHTVTESASATSAMEYKQHGLFNSLFYSGNFGIIFYVLLVNVVAYMKKILSGPLIWETVFLGVFFVEIYYIMVIRHTNLPMFESGVHRVVMVFSVISALFLASLWTRDGTR